MTPTYFPTCKNKHAELSALGERLNAEKTLIEPIIVIAPLLEEDSNTVSLFDDKRQPSFLPALKTLRSGYRCFVDARQAMCENEGELGLGWLRLAYKQARAAGHDIAPVVTWDMPAELLTVYRGILWDMSEDARLALIVTADDVEEEDFAETLSGTLIAAGIAREQVTVLADFSTADLSLQGANEAVESVLLNLDGMGQWSTLVFRGGSFPSQYPKNGAKQIIAQTVIDNNEARLWPTMFNLSAEMRNSIGYGDFLAEGPVFHFPKKKGQGGRAYNAIRWAAPDGLSWMWQIGGRSEKPTDEMPVVARVVQESDHVSADDFSQAAIHLDLIVRGQLCGTPTDWRKLAARRHIDMVLLMTLKTVEALAGDPRLLVAPAVTRELFESE